MGSSVLACVMVVSTSWMGDSAEDFAALPEILEAHVIAGSASVPLKVRTATTEQLQDVLRRLYAIDGVSGTQATVVLETFFERPLSPRSGDQPRSPRGPASTPETPSGRQSR